MNVLLNLTVCSYSFYRVKIKKKSLWIAHSVWENQAPATAPQYPLCAQELTGNNSGRISAWKTKTTTSSWWESKYVDLSYLGSSILTRRAEAWPSASFNRSPTDTFLLEVRRELGGLRRQWQRCQRTAVCWERMCSTWARSQEMPGSAGREREREGTEGEKENVYKGNQCKKPQQTAAAADTESRSRICSFLAHRAENKWISIVNESLCTLQKCC